LRAKRRESIAKLDELLQATFLDMFGDPVTNPKGWGTTTIGTHMKVLSGFAFRSADFAESGLPIVRISNLDGDSINLEKCVRIPPQFLGKGLNFMLQPGDTLIAMSGATTGKLGFVPDGLVDKWFLNQRVGAFRVAKDSAVDRAFLRALLRSSFYQNHVWNLAGGAAQPNISGKQLESARIPLPPLDLQHHFAAIVGSVEDQKARLLSSLAKLDTLFASLQSRAFKGELQLCQPM
jgi:type I restriction enzyme, S subunit